MYTTFDVGKDDKKITENQFIYYEQLWQNDKKIH